MATPATTTMPAAVMSNVGWNTSYGSGVGGGATSTYASPYQANDSWNTVPSMATSKPSMTSINSSRQQQIDSDDSDDFDDV